MNIALFMYNFSLHILPFFLLLITTFLSASVRPAISSEKCLQDVMFHFAEHTVGDEEIYFYHSDHLGSASWITAKNGKPIQYIHYLPYGEILANQRISGYDERFKFTTKELDEESGYYYFGARYLLSELGDFLSPDPLTDKTPELSSYMYCNGNPIRFIDPKGEEWLTADDAQQAHRYMQEIENKISKMTARIEKLKNNANKIDILKQRISILQQGRNELQEMEDMKGMKFTYKNLPVNNNNGYTQFLDKDIIEMGVPIGETELGLHESSHGYDFAKLGGTYLEHEKIPGEIKAYQRQFSFSPKSIPMSVGFKRVKNFNQITQAWVLNIYTISNGTLVFPYR